MNNQDSVYHTDSNAKPIDCKEYTRQRLSALIPKLQQIAVGDFSVEFVIPTEEDELTELTTALNLMLDDLREYKKAQDSLTQDLQQKIKELETFNAAMVNRELKMIDLKKENAALKAQLSQSKNLSPEDKKGTI